jgi:L-rhamnose mutarotase
MRFKRYCKTLKLQNDPDLIARYKEAHAMGKVWPEVLQEMKKVGILDMEIYIHGNTLFMIMEAVEDFDHEQAFKKLAGQPRQAEWERHMSQFQRAPVDSKADEKWQLMERVFEMDQRSAYAANAGQLKVSY